jgi:predicted lipoprotein with Yx(FWY)xxD motif
MFTRTQSPWRNDSPRRVWRRTVRRFATSATAIGAGVATFAALPVVGASAGAAATATATGTVVSMESSPYGTVLMAGSGQFSGYTLYTFNRNTAKACNATTMATVMGQPLTCAGAETDKTAEWPALTTDGKPVAGPGVNKHLLGMVYRKDIRADQVTYAGNLLYLFDMGAHQFTGVNFMDLVAPLAPWHGVWRPVSAKNGLEVAGPVAVSTQKQADGSTVLAAGMFQGIAGSSGLPIVVYSYSKDTKNHSNCTGTCALDWPPVLTSAAAQAGAGVSQSSLGKIRRSDGTEQLTFDGKPLYFYSEEVPQFNQQTGNPENPASLGTGNGLKGPGHAGTFKVVAATS